MFENRKKMPKITIGFELQNNYLLEQNNERKNGPLFVHPCRKTVDADISICLQYEFVMIICFHEGRKGLWKNHQQNRKTMQ